MRISNTRPIFFRVILLRTVREVPLGHRPWTVVCVDLAIRNTIFCCWQLRRWWTMTGAVHRTCRSGKVASRSRAVSRGELGFKRSMVGRSVRIMVRGCPLCLRWRLPRPHFTTCTMRRLALLVLLVLLVMPVMREDTRAMDCRALKDRHPSYQRARTTHDN